MSVVLLQQGSASSEQRWDACRDGGSTQHLSLLHIGLARWYLPEAGDSTEQLSSHVGDTGVAAV